MAITKMRLMNIITDKQHLEEMLLRFSTLDNFHPELANKIVDRVSGLAVLNDANPYADLLSKVSELCAEMDLTLVKKPIDSYFINLDETNKMINEIKAKFDQIHEIKKELQTVIEENKMAVIQVKNVSAMNINFDDLFSCRYLKIRVGRMPKQSVDKLQYYNNRPYIFKEINKDEHFCWCMYITTMRYEGEVDNIFSSLHFERVRIPDFVHGTPEGAIKELEEDMKQDQEHLDHVIETEKKFVEESAERLSELYTKLQCLNQTYEVQKYVVLLGERASISGFVPEEDVERVKQQFADIANVEVEVRPAHSDSRLTPPTKLKNNWFVRPFEMFVEMYGMPCYEDFDPTPFVALTYCLLFGIMFADVGQGLVLSLVGYIAYKKMNMRLGEVGMRIGLFSAFFGLIFGSVFGNEELLNPMFHALGFAEKPFEVMAPSFVMPLLISAIAIGAVLILVSMLINVTQSLKNKQLGKALFSQNGIAGFVLYGSLLVGIALQMGAGIQVLTLPYILILIGIPAVLIFMQEPLERLLEHEKLFPNGFGGFFMEAFFEMFEICLTFLANTMSYLRVGGFVLSHAGMMLVVSTLMSMVGNASPLVFVLGNIFVMVLEGMIVGIQVLRLEFYEMFSRYFDGNGIAFKALNNN